MADLSWKEITNLENSLYEFLIDRLDTDNLTVKDEKGVSREVTVRIGETPNDNWTMPVISFYEDSQLAPRGFIGSNRRLKEHLLILDVRTLNPRMQRDLTDWLTDAINDGFDFYEYTASGDPMNPTKTLLGKVSIEFIANRPLRLGDNVDAIDKYRQNININCQITITES